MIISVIVFVKEIISYYVMLEPDHYGLKCDHFEKN
jgi:hypothetical protein